MSYQIPPRWDKNRPVYLEIGIILSLFIVYEIIQLNFSPQCIGTYNEVYFEDYQILIPPQTSQEKKKIPKPEIPKIALVNPEIEIADEIEEISTPMEPDDKIIISFEDRSTLKSYVEEVPIVSPEEKVEEDIPIRFADRMPIFGDCIQDEIDPKVCSNKAILSYLYEHLKYPAIARENGIDGQVVIRFVVRKDGRISDLEIQRDIGAGCGAAALNVIQNMPDWTPGKQNGKPISVYFTLPVRFKLEG